MRGSAVTVSSSLVAVIACNGLLDIQDRPLELADGGVAEAATGDGGLGETGAPDAATTEGGGPTISRYRKAVLDDKPSVYLRFGEAGGTVAIDEMNPVAPGEYQSNGITLGEKGAIADDPDTAAHFDGSTRIKMKPGADFAGNAVFSVEVWIKHDTATSPDEFLIDHEDIENSPRQGWYVTADLGGVVAGRWANDTSHGASGAGPVIAGQWHHLVATYDGQRQRVFIDAKLGESNIVDVSLSATKDWAVGGINCPCSASSFIGVIDELAIYPSILTEQQIKAHYAASGREVPDGG